MLRTIVRLTSSSSHLTKTCGISPSVCHFSILSFLPSRKKLVPRGTRSPPPPLPPPKYLQLQDKCTLEYIDIQSKNGDDVQEPVTLVFLHGAPGSYQDFRYLIPLVQRPGMRIIGINLPGYEGSKVAQKHFLESISALPTADLALDAVQQLCEGHKFSKNTFLVGHSFGAHTAINMAASLSMSSKSKSSLSFRGLALLAPVGCSPHHVMRPRANALVIKMLDSGYPLVAATASHAVKAIYTKLLRFPSDWPADPFVAAVVRAGTTNFDVVRDQVALLRRLEMPTLIAWSQSDEYIQEEVPVELEQLCFAGPRLVFAGGGHNIQKTRVDPIAIAISDWVTDMLSKESPSPNKPQMQFLP